MRYLLVTIIVLAFALRTTDAFVPSSPSIHSSAFPSWCRNNIAKSNTHQLQFSLINAVDDFFVPHAHLPENSIYRLKMTDVTGNEIDLSQFSGMVSLVVNTACH